MIIFLDIDGVLNKHKLADNNYCPLDAECVHNFNQLLLQLPDAKVVVHSSWRYLVTEDTMTLKGLIALLLSHGLSVFDDKVVGITERDEVTAERLGFPLAQFEDSRAWRQWNIEHGTECRKKQIEEYIRANDVKVYVILDDLDLDMEKQVQTQGQEGLTLAKAKEAFFVIQAQK